MEFRERPAFRCRQSLRSLFRTAFVVAFLCPVLLAACSYKRPILTRTDPRGPATHRGAAAATESIPYTGHHLYGWREAEAAYEEAYGNSPDPMILHKLLTTQFLILTREGQEGIYGPFQDERLSALCSRGTTSFHEVLCRSAQERLRQRRSMPVGKARIPSPYWDREIPVENPLLAAHLRFLLTGQNQDSEQSGKNPLEVLDPDRSSPLTLYLVWKSKRLEKVADHVERHPGFAELLLYQGSRLLEEARYAEAIDSMTEAVRLVPEYTKAMVGLGEFHLRSLHLYQRALRYFEDALTWDPQNISALFGRGVVLHLLGQHEPSRHSLDRLLELAPAVWNSIPQESRKSFRARACYWKAEELLRGRVIGEGTGMGRPSLGRLAPLRSGPVSVWHSPLGEGEISHRLAPEFLKVVDGRHRVVRCVLSIGSAQPVPARARHLGQLHEQCLLSAAKAVQSE